MLNVIRKMQIESQWGTTHLIEWPIQIKIQNQTPKKKNRQANKKKNIQLKNNSHNESQNEYLQGCWVTATFSYCCGHAKLYSQFGKQFGSFLYS